MNAFHAISQEIYKQTTQNQQAQQQPGQQADAGPKDKSKSPDDNIVDADFKVVDDDGKDNKQK